jgi:uncharacterized membrane protein YhfC
LLVVSFLIAIITAIGLPFVVARWTTRQYSVAWIVFWTGFLTYIGSQFLRSLFITGMNSLTARGALPQPSQSTHVLYGLLLVGLAAGLFQNAGRWVGFRLLKEKGNSWGGALTLGAGHGGLEMILIGLSILVTFVIVMVFTNSGPQALPFLGQMGTAISMQSSEFWGQVWYSPLAQGFELVAGFMGQIVLAVMVWLSIYKRSWLWFVLAVLWQAVLESVPAMAAGLNLTTFPRAGLIGFFLLINAVILYALNQWLRTGKPVKKIVEVS